MNAKLGHNLVYQQRIPTGINDELLQSDTIAQQLEMLRRKIDALEAKGTKKLYTDQDLCPNPFDKSLYMPPFPKHFEAPNFEKYKGNGNPKDHIRAFFTACTEVSYEETYLMRLFA